MNMVDLIKFNYHDIVYMYYYSMKIATFNVNNIYVQNWTEITYEIIFAKNTLMRGAGHLHDKK